MLRYYMYAYLCGAAITTYVGFLKLRFEEMDKRVFPAFEPADSDGEQSAESARNRVKRQILERISKNDDPLIKKVEEFHRVFQAMKLRRLQHGSPSEPKVKVTRRQSSSPLEAPLKKKMEEGTRRTRMRKKRQTEAEIPTEKEMKKKLRRVRRDKEADEMLQEAHEEKDQQDIYQGDPNDFFDEEKQVLEDNQVEEGVAKQLFVIHWLRTLGYFVFLQALIFFILLFAFWSYGYYRYEIWKSKVDGFFKDVVETFQSFNKPEVGTTIKTETANVDIEEAMEDLQEAGDKRDEVLSRKLDKREQQDALQKAAFQNVQRIKQERERRKKAAEETKKKPKKTDGKLKQKGKETQKSKDKKKSAKKADGKKLKSKSDKKEASAKKAKKETGQPVTAEGGVETAPQMVPGYYYPGYDAGYYPGYYQQ